ncbi:MAG: hypothetical protein BGO03_09250 [Mesorhizobium sp. 61-13]|nr:MAG: hypothetical protein BGO03_09250 [Mesorhizobium sp. 61-13]
MVDVPQIPSAHQSAEAVNFAATDAQNRQAAIVDLLRNLIRQKTHESSQCLAGSRLVETAMRENGFDVERHEPLDDAGEKLPTILGWLGKRTKYPDVLLCAHIDTSPGGTGWTRDPFGAEQSDGLIYGRGSVVSKSDIACFIHAAAAAHLAAPFGTVLVAVTSDEGSGGDHGAAYLLNEMGLRPALAIFPGFTDVITVGHNGCVQLKVRISGASCHQSIVRPEEDAMRRATQVCADIYAFADALSISSEGPVKPTLNVTKTVGGTVFGMSPGEVEIWVDRRLTPEETLGVARAELEGIFSKTASSRGTTLSVETVRMAEPMRPAPDQDAFVRILSEEGKSTNGRDLPLAVSTLYTDARWFSNAGIPTIMFGAGESDISVSRANGADERVPEHCLSDAAAILARAIVRHLLDRNTK